MEKGLTGWGDDSAQLEQKILMSYVKKSVSISSKTGKEAKSSSFGNRPEEKKVWFCSAYNRNSCSYQEPHLTKINDKSFVVKHICASCYQKDKCEQFHRKKSAGCP